MAPKYTILPSATTAVHSDPAVAGGDGDESSLPPKSIEITLNTKSRHAIVYFSGPLQDKIISCLDLPQIKHNKENDILDESGEVVVGNKGVAYEPIRALDHLLMKINRTNDV